MSGETKQKRKEVAEAVILRKEPVSTVARVFNIPLISAFDWLASYRQGGWRTLIEIKPERSPQKNYR